MTYPLNGTDCAFCIDQLQPAGIHDILGPVYAGCMACFGVCPNCQGDGLFPADQNCPGCYTRALLQLGLIPVRCSNCFGICDLIPTNDIPEVSPHVHH